MRGMRERGGRREGEGRKGRGSKIEGGGKVGIKVHVGCRQQ